MLEKLYQNKKSRSSFTYTSVKKKTHDFFTLVTRVNVAASSD